MSISTIGYEGRSLDEFVACLIDAGVEVLIDVRQRAQSRKRWFSKTALGERLRSSGIEYRHEPSLEKPRENREPLRAGVREARTRYLEILTNDAKSSFDELLRAAAAKSICLMCFEVDHESCHRSCITELATELHPNRNIERL